MRRLACVLAALLAPGAAGGQSTDPLTPLRDSGRPGWTAAWGPLAGLNADQRVLPSAPELPGLLDAPAPRVGQFWSAANPAALAYEVTGSWGEIRLRKGGERGTHRRPLDAADYGIRQFSGLRWQPLGGRSAVVGQVTADETISDAGSLSPFLVRHSPDPFAVTDAMTPPMRHIRVRAEGAYGWRAGPWGFGAGLGLEVSDDRSMETRTPRLGRTSAPALSFGLLRVLDAGFTVSAHGRWIGAHENSRIAVPRGTKIVVRELDGFGEPQPLRVAGPDIFGRSVGRARRTAGAALSGRTRTWQWVARGEHEDIGHEHESSRLSTDPPNRWEAGTWRIGLDVLGHAGPLRAAVSAVYTTLDGDAFRRDLVGQGAIFRVRQTAFLGRVDLRMPLTDSAWIAAVRVSVRRESRLRHDFLIAAASDLRAWHPGVSVEIARHLSKHTALSLGGGASGYEPAGFVPVAGVFGAVDPVLVAPELALYSARARAYTASVAIRVRLARGPALVTRGRFERLVPVVVERDGQRHLGSRRRGICPLTRVGTVHAAGVVPTYRHVGMCQFVRSGFGMPRCVDRRGTSAVQSSAMSDLFFELALLPGGWTRNLRVEVTADGDFGEILTGADPEGARRVRGAAVPGIPNLHSHAFQRAMAGLTERGSTAERGFWSWRERMYAFLARLTPDHVQAIAAQLYAEMLRHGYTAVTEFHYLRNDLDGKPYALPHEMALRLHEAAADTGIGLTLLPAVYRVADFGADAPAPEQCRFVTTVDEILADGEALRQATAGAGNRRVGLALHSLRAVPPDDLADAVAALHAADPDAPVHIHVAEQVREVQACLAWSGASPVEWLLDHAPVDSRWCAVHATHMTGEETRALAASGAVAGLCPTTEANLGDGVFPLASYLVGGGRWGVGSDSHISVSPAADLRMLEYSQRLTMHERNIAAGRKQHSTGRALLEGAWAGGAQASGRRLGAIRTGSRADIVVLDTEHPALVGRRQNELLDAWIFSGEDTPVRDVMVGGAWVVKDGRHRAQEEIADAYRALSRRLSAAR